MDDAQISQIVRMKNNLYKKLKDTHQPKYVALANKLRENSNVVNVTLRKSWQQILNLSLSMHMLKVDPKLQPG